MNFLIFSSLICHISGFMYAVFDRRYRGKHLTFWWGMYGPKEPIGYLSFDVRQMLCSQLLNYVCAAMCLDKLNKLISAKMAQKILSSVKIS